MDSHFAIWRVLFLLPLVLVCTLLAGGVVLLKLAIFPRRRGAEPHCAACNYLLIGNVSGRCPECGHDLALPNSVRLGQRRRRPGLAIVGILLLLLGITPAVFIAASYVDGIDWYQYRPTSWVVEDVGSSNIVQANRGWAELDRRRKLPAGLSAAIEQKLVAVALKEQARPVQSSVGSQLVDFLGDMFIAGKLSKAQTDLFFTQAMSLQLSVRPIVIVGDDVPYLVGHTGRVPSSNWWCRVHDVQAGIDDRMISAGSGSSTSSGSGGGSSGSYFKITVPGKHTVEVTNRVEFYHGPFGKEKASRLCYTRTVTLKADFQALEKAPIDYVKLIADPALKPLIQKAIAFTRFERESGGRLRLTIEVDNAPANVAFDVFARADAREYHLGSIAVPKGRQRGYGFDTVSLNAVTANKLDFIFRSSEPAARKTTDLFEIWSGEILLKDVTITQRPPPQTQSARQPN